MKIKNYSQLGIFMTILTIILSFVLAFFWYVDFPHDDAEGIGAIHIIFNIICIIAICISGFSACGFFIESGDNKTLDNPIIIAKKWFIIPTIVLLGFLLIGWCTSPFTAMKTMYNNHIQYVNKYEKISYERKSYFDKMYKTYLQKNTICEINKDAFIETTKIIMEGRHDGEQVAWKWVTENQNIPYNQFTVFYANLSTFVQEQREGYYKLEQEAMDVVQENNTMLDTFPNNIYNKVLGVEHMKFEPGFTSSHTDSVFTTKHENL